MTKLATRARFIYSTSFARQLATSILVLALIACSVSKNSSITSAFLDGSTIKKAVPVKSIMEEYQWMKDNYAGADVISQSLIKKNNKYYDQWNMHTLEGDAKSIYFDITSFYKANTR